jgi:hypothetical protein
MSARALSGAPLQRNAKENGLPHLINPVSKLILCFISPLNQDGGELGPILFPYFPRNI